MEWKCLVEVSCVLQSAAQAGQPAVVARELGPAKIRDDSAKAAGRFFYFFLVSR
jgi:hypothetical protein